MLRHRTECFDVVSETDYADIRKSNVVTLEKKNLRLNKACLCWHPRITMSHLIYAEKENRLSIISLYPVSFKHHQHEYTHSLFPDNCPG